MKALGILVLLLLGFCAIKYLLMNQPALVHTEATPSPSPSVTPTPAPSPQAKATLTRKDEFADIFNPDGSLRPLPAGTKIQDVWGRVFQHLNDGKILLESNLGLIALIYPGDDGTVDGQFTGKFKGVICGTYQYDTVDGGTRTIREVLYIPLEALPKPKPGDWLWSQDRGNPLEQRPRR